MRQSGIDVLLSQLAVSSMVIGAVLLVALLVRRSPTGLVLAAAFGAVAGIVAEPMVWLNEAPLAVLAQAGACAAIAATALVVVRSLLGGAIPELRDRLADILSPACWSGEEPVGAQDLLRRWYVTITATTGAVMGGLLLQGLLVPALAASMQPRNLLVALVLAAVSPFVAGRLHGEGRDRGHSSAAMAEPGSLADGTTGPLPLIILSCLQLWLLAGSAGVILHTGDLRLVYGMIGLGAAAAVVSHYWCAALQSRSPSIIRQTLVPTVLAAAIVQLGPMLVLSGALALDVMELRRGRGGEEFVFVAVFMSAGITLATMAGAVAATFHAVLGGHVIQRYPARQAIALLPAALLLATALQIALMLVAATIAGIDLGSLGFGLGLAAALGWAAGLWAAGFARVVSEGAMARPLARAHATSAAPA